MKYVLNSSLEHIAAVNVSIALWNQNDVRVSLEKFMNLSNASEKRKKWHKIEKRVIKKVQQIPQPGILKEKISSLIKPIGLQILKWTEYHCTGYCLYVDFPPTFFWTPQGQVDRKKTAEALIKDDRLDVGMRYKFACIYCSEDNILKLWNKMSDNCRESLSSEVYPGESNRNLIRFWTSEMKRNVARLNNSTESTFSHSHSYLRAFEYAAEVGSKAAIEYFWGKLTLNEIEKTLIDITGRIIVCYITSYYGDSIHIPKEDYSSILYFLLSQMEEEQEKELFKKCRSQVLILFLEWPWQSLVMEMASHMWDFLSEADYCGLLSEIIGKVRDGYKDFNYQNLFAELWRNNHDTDKKGIILKPDCADLLSALFEIKDERNIRLILQDLTLTEKQELFIHSGFHICENLICSNDLTLLEFFIRECEPPEDVIMKFKESFWTHRSFRCPVDKDKLDKIFQKLDEFACWFGNKKCL